MIQIASIVSV